MRSLREHDQVVKIFSLFVLLRHLTPNKSLGFNNSDTSVTKLPPTFGISISTGSIPLLKSIFTPLEGMTYKSCKDALSSVAKVMANMMLCAKELLLAC